ncbi:ScbR family autoregulator-binding transcription factor [Amycolatopsis nigrescens]|uniref:ScbR family autoregulator-binding transcription factor n=1 Tax=Amycolatopsis nigrescens TaxID=381445 RepID=UPI00037F9EB8|nr:ScbR family autoregulator-binding transcription factor [Amycolatopsis nigrescens]
MPENDTGHDPGDDRRPVSTRHRLLLAAAREFDHDGFSRTRLQAVCARAKVTKGALYCHFRSKEALALALIERQALVCQALKCELLRHGRGPAQTLVDLPFAFLRRLDEDLLTRAGNRLLREATLFDRAAAGQVIGWTTTVRELLKLADDAGELRHGLNLRHVAEALVAEFFGQQLVSQAMTGQRDLPARLVRGWQAGLPLLVPSATLAGLRIGEDAGTS